MRASKIFVGASSCLVASCAFSHDFGTFGRYQELPLEEMSPEQKRAYEFTVQERGLVPGPYKIWLQNPKLIDVMVPLGVYYQKHSSLTKAEIEIATNLINARWLAAYSNYEAEAIRTLATGGLPDDLSEEEKIVQRYARKLSAEHRVDAALYSAAEHASGQQGVVDLAYLIGIYHVTCALLNAFDIPAPSEQI